MQPQPVTSTLTIEVHEIGSSALRLTVAGEVDMATAGQLDQTLRTVLRERPPDTLIVDLTGVPFLDCAGVAVLVSNHRYAEREAATTMALTGARPIVHRVLCALGLGGLLRTRPELHAVCC